MANVLDTPTTILASAARTATATSAAFRRPPTSRGYTLMDLRHRVVNQLGEVLVDFTDGDRAWTTTGVSPNIIEASWQALTDGIVFGLLHADR